MIERPSAYKNCIQLWNQLFTKLQAQWLKKICIEIINTNVDNRQKTAVNVSVDIN